MRACQYSSPPRSMESRMSRRVNAMVWASWSAASIGPDGGNATAGSTGFAAGRPASEVRSVAPRRRAAGECERVAGREQRRRRGVGGRARAQALEGQRAVAGDEHDVAGAPASQDRPGAGPGDNGERVEQAGGDRARVVQGRSVDDVDG